MSRTQHTHRADRRDVPKPHAETQARRATLEISARPSAEVICRECSEPFVMSGQEQVWFELRGLALPKRCPPCRRMRRELLRTTEPTTHA